MDERTWQKLEAARDILNEANEHYYKWVEHMLTVSVGALTLLISFQDKFVPASPRLLWCLSGAWIGLAISIAAGAIIMHGRYVVMQRMGKDKVDKALNPPAGPTIKAENLTGIAWAAMTAFPWLLTVSLALLVTFAVANVDAGHVIE